MKPTVLVTGGAGFLGHALVRDLLVGDGPLGRCREVRVLDPVTSEHAGARSIAGDIRDQDAVVEACAGVDLVIHCAALVDWGRHSARTLESINVTGTENVIAACQRAGVPALVHTSTLDVVYTGDAVVDGNEQLPYPARFVNGYCRTKAHAEQRALAANGSALDAGGLLRTTVVRPCSIFGERDPYHVPPLIEMARAGKLFRIGDGSARSQMVYVGNVAHCLALAGRSLLSDEPRAAGAVYFVTDVAPKNFFDFFAPMVEAAGVTMPARSLPRAPLYALGASMEALAWLLRPLVSFTPNLTRFAVDYVSLDFTFASDKAARELGYAPRYGETEAIERTVRHFRDAYDNGTLVPQRT